MKTKKIQHPQILAFIATGMALLVAIIVSSLAWFTANGQSTVYTEALTLISAKADSLSITVPETLAEYERYMGETGTKYNNDDYPYMIEYDPIIVTMGAANAELLTQYFRYLVDESSYIRKAVSGVADEPIDSASAIKNFSIVLEELDKVVTYDEETGEVVSTDYVPNGNTYWSENGFFRSVNPTTLARGALLSLPQGETYFRMKLYFQGDYAFHLLELYQANIDDKYTFDYSNPSYMFSKFVLTIVFDIRDEFMLTFHPVGYDNQTILDGDDLSSNNQLSGYTATSGGSIYQTPYTGYDFLRADGVQRNLAIPNLSKGGQPAGEYYFVDWVYIYEDELEKQHLVYYRDTKAGGTASNVTTLALRPLRGNADLYGVWAASPAVTIMTLPDEEDPAVCYVRPQGNHYGAPGYMYYDTAAKTITVYNPTGASSMETMYTVPTPTRAGYRFMGWSTTQQEDLAAGETYSAGVYAFSAGQSYRLSPSQDITLYAVWQEIGATITFSLNEVWGNGYATVVGTNITKGSQVIAVTDGIATVEVSKSATIASYNFGANATATFANSTTRALTVKYWVYYDSTTHEYIKVENDFKATADMTLYPIWNERAEYTVTLDINMYSSAVLWNYGIIDITTPKSINYYTLNFDDGNISDTIGKFGQNADKDHQTITFKVLEGVTLGSLNFSVEWRRHGGGLNTNAFAGWYENVNNDIATTSWVLTNGSKPKYDTTSLITGNITLYVRFD